MTAKSVQLFYKWKALASLRRPVRSEAKHDHSPDLVRATGIALVVVFHTVQMSPVDFGAAQSIARLGRYGVDIFFTLSGYLIGGLAVRELAITGQLNIARFWYRRWLRTIPPYLVALAASWAAVYISRSEPFSPYYLFFGQNYFEKLPFFLVSWSLCVEEHFYLGLPLFLVIFKGLRLPISALPMLCISLAALSPALRLLTGDPTAPFGIQHAATHLNLHGLALGVAIALLRHKEFVSHWLFRTCACALIIFAVGAACALEWIDATLEYVIGPTLVAIATALFLLTTQKLRLRERTAVVVGAVATTSYSAYLVHPLCLHAATALSQRFGNSTELYFTVAAILILSATAVFYILVEKSAILVRDRYQSTFFGAEKLPPTPNR